MRAALGELEGRADLVVALCHTGISHRPSAPGAENAGQDLARLDGLDALILGHQHLLLPGEDFAGFPGVDAERGTIHGKPAVMAGFSGSHLGIIDLELEKGANWRVARAQVEARPIARRDAGGDAVALVESDASILEAARPAHEATLGAIRRPVGWLASRLSTYFALIGDDSGSRARQCGSARPCRASRGGARGPRLAAASFGFSAVQMRRAGRIPFLYRHRRRAARDQERRGHLPLSQHAQRG